jgi:hypothetical protein
VGAVRDARDRLEARTELLGRMEADVRSTSRLEDSAAAVRTRVVALAPELLGPGGESEAVAALGALLSSAAERQRVRVSRTEAVPDSARAGPARRVSVRATLESETAGLLGMLEALARQRAVLTVGSLQIAADPPPVASAPELLHTEFTLSGWYLPARTSR